MASASSQMSLFGSTERAESVVADGSAEQFKVWSGRLWRINGSTWTSWPCGIDAELIAELESIGVKNLDNE